MPRAIEALKVALLAWWLLISLGLGFELMRLRPTLETTLRDTHITILEAGLTLKNLREASLEWKNASKQQAQDTSLAMSHVSAAAKELSLLVSRTDDSLNSKLLPSLEQAIVAENAALLANQTDLGANLKEMLLATQSAQKVLLDLDAQVSSPDVKIALDNLAETTKNASEGTAQLAAIAADGRQVADKFRDDYLKPQKFAWELLKQLIGLGGSLAQMVK